MKRRKIGRGTAILLAAALLLGGCAGKDDAARPKAGEEGRDKPVSLQGLQEETGDPMAGDSVAGNSVAGDSAAGNSAAVAPAEDNSWTGLGGCYKLADPKLDSQTQKICMLDGELYSLQLRPECDFSMQLYRGEEKLFESLDIRGMAAGSGGIWVLCNTAERGGGNQAKFELIKLNKNGQEASRQDITQLLKRASPLDMITDGQGMIFVLSMEEVLRFSEDGTFLDRIACPSGQRLISGGDGQAYVAGIMEEESQSGNALAAVSEQQTSSWKVIRLDWEKKEAETAAEYPNYRVFDGGGDVLFTLSDGDGLYGVKGMEEEPEPVALWAELGLSFNRIGVVNWMQGGDILMRTLNMKWVMLTPSEPSEIKQRQVLTMAIVAPWAYGVSLAGDFNLQGTEYVIKVVDYSKDGTVETDDAITALNLDIISGKAPDLFDFTLLPERYYTDKGLVEDLYPYMDKEPEMEREDYLALDKLERDGRLYYLTNGFSLDTVVGLRSRFGDRNGWSLDDYLDIQSQCAGDIMYNITKERFLENIVRRYAATAVDWEAGTCDFDSEEFIHILQAVSQIRENPEPERTADLDFAPVGQRLREEKLIVALWYIQGVKNIVAAEKEVGEEISFVGWPTPDGEGGTVLHPQSLIGICSKGNRNGAWEFLKYVLNQRSGDTESHFMPVSKSALEAQIDKALKADPDQPAGPMNPRANEKQAERLYNLIEASVYYGTASEEAVSIVMEEAAPFLAGDRTAEDTAHIIQSRVRLLAAE